MALGNSWTTIASGSQTINGAKLTYYIDAYLSSQSIANNQSVCPVRARTVFSGYNMSSYNYSFSCTGCATKSGSGIYYFGTETVLEGSVTVNHNADGTGSLSVSGACVGSGIGLNIQVSGSVALPTIPRASSATFDKSAITLNGTNKFAITINRASTSFTHTLKFAMGSVSTTISNVGASTEWQPSVSKWMPACNLQSNTVTVTLTTYSGSTQIGSSVAYTLKLNVDKNAYKPVIGSITLSDTNATSAALESSGSYIQRKSNLNVEVTFGVSDASYVSLVGATITLGNDTRSITLSGTSSTQTVTFREISSSSLKITVTDARSVTVTSTRSLNIIPYNNIIVQSANYARTNASGAATEVGDHIKLNVVTLGFVGTFGQAENVQTLSYRYKLRSASAYSSYVTAGTYSSSSTGSITTHTFEVQPSQTFDFSKQYDVQVRIVDQFSSSTMNIVVHQGLPSYAWGSDHFDVYGDFHIHSKDDPTKYTVIGALGYMPPAVVLTDCDDATQYGVRYRATSTTANTPINAYFQIYVFPYSTNYMTQIAFHTNTQGSRMWVRSNNDNGWGPWREINAHSVVPPQITRQFTSANVTCSANSAGSVEITVSTPAGYSFLGVIGVWSNGDIVPCYSNSSTLSSGKVTVWWRNPTGSATTVSFTANIMFCAT